MTNPSHQPPIAATECQMLAKVVPLNLVFPIQTVRSFLASIYLRRTALIVVW